MSTTNLNENGNRTTAADDAVMLTEYYKGNPDASVVWNDSQRDVYINGVSIPKSDVYLSQDGKAFVSRGVADNIFKNSLSSDPTSSYSIFKSYDKAYKELDKYYDNVRNYGNFSYDYKNDPSYKAYSQYYDYLADKSVDDALTQMMGRTGGYVNSNALATAYQAKNNLMREKANIIPQLEQNAYNRWNADRENYVNGVGNALKNIMSYNSDWANTALAMKQLETERENSIYDRLQKDNQFYASLNQADRQFLDSLSIDQQRLLLEYMYKYGKTEGKNLYIKNNFNSNVIPIN